MRLFVAVALGLAALSTAAVIFVQTNGWTLYYGDAEAHLNIARRVLDSRTPGYDQIGTVWLPLPHVLMLPFVWNDYLWRTGLAGVIPSAIGFVLSGLFLFAAALRLFGSKPAAFASLACFALNPNLLYLQATPMTEAVFFACLLGSLRFAGLGTVGASLTRYEGWFLIPFVFLWRGFRGAGLYPAAAAIRLLLAPLYWLAHNWWYFGNALEFYNGPYSAKAIQADKPYPGFHDWAQAILYYRTAIELTVGWGAMIAAILGLVVVIRRRAWLALFLLLPPLFYVWSIHSSGTPLFVPTLWPHSYYNTRYGLAALPFIALSAGAAVLIVPPRFRWFAALAVAAVSIPHAAICWKESQVNSEERRAWTHQTAKFLAAEYRPGSGIFAALGDVAGAFREAGIPFRQVLQEGNEPAWQAAVNRPDLFLHEEWVVGLDPKDPRYQLVVRFGPVPIYRRSIPVRTDLAGLPALP